MTRAARLIMVGCGHMGYAMVRGLHGRSPWAEIVVVETSPERRTTLSERDGLTVSADLEIAEGDFVVLAIPPQAFEAFVRSRRHTFTPTTPVLSVMAGLTADSIARDLGTSQVVRSIPNTPSEIFEGMSVYFADTAVSKETIAQADLLLGSIGKTLRVASEKLVDDATALCGGGPAFVSYIMDAFCRFAVSRGFTPEAGRDMAVQVFSGTAALVAGSGRPPMQLCREVMTPNGTTERGVDVFDHVGMKQHIHDALTASAERSAELGTALSGGRCPGDADV
ncbi:pyrroline-5-carboxylate reductase [Streptomyces sp. NPDC001985]|uniref:pyrroline-5-carboxylate reductase n=1 Tax=Streptomyces sp. NPDC001985 TaxID=3154406 RepID=UPI003328A8EB